MAQRLKKRAAATEPLSRACGAPFRSLSNCIRNAAGLRSPPLAVPLCGDRVHICNGGLHVPSGHVLVTTGDLTLSNVTVSGGGVAGIGHASAPLLFADGGSLTLESVRVCNNPCGHGVGVGAGAAVTAADCSFGSNATSGAVVRGAGARLTAERCWFDNNGQDGATASDGAALRVTACSFTHNAMLGLTVAGEGTNAHVARSSADRNADHGFVASAAAELALDECTAAGNDVGAAALGAGTSLAAAGGALTANQHGVHVRDGARAALAAVSLFTNVRGACVTDPGSRLQLKECSVVESSEVGLAVLCGATAALERGSVASSGGHGVVVQHAKSELAAEDAVIERNGQAGVCVSIMGRATLRNGELRGNSVSGVQATVRAPLAAR